MPDTDVRPYNGMACRWLGNEQVQLAITTDRGPRIVFWGRPGGANLFAEAPDAVIPTPDGPFHLLGGHRLWYAPEVLNRTYGPDNDPVAVDEGPGGLVFSGRADAAGIVKQIAVAVAVDRPEVVGSS
jgi:hypothetical protein